MYTHEKIVYLIFGIHKYLPLYMYIYTDKVTKMYKYNYAHAYTSTIHIDIRTFRPTYI